MVHPHPPQNWFAHRRAVVDKQGAVELAAFRLRVGRRPQLRQRALRRSHARTPGEHLEKALAAAATSLTDADGLQIGVGQPRVGDEAGGGGAGAG
jgi:hypothetical protein